MRKHYVTNGSFPISRWQKQKKGEILFSTDCVCGAICCSNMLRAAAQLTSGSTVWSHATSAAETQERHLRFHRIVTVRQVEFLHVSSEPVLVSGRVQRASGGSRMHHTETWNG